LKFLYHFNTAFPNRLQVRSLSYRISEHDEPRFLRISLQWEGLSVGYRVYVDDISKDNDSLSKCGFLNLLLQLTYQLLQATQETLGSVLDEMLRQIGQFCSADRSSIFLAESDDHMSCAYNWYVDSKAPPLTDLNSISLSLFPHWHEALHQGQEVYIFSASDLPASWQSEREILAKYGVTSVLMEPICSDNHLLGFVGLDTKGHTLTWSEQMKGVLYLFANILGAFFARMKTEQKLKVSLKTSADLITQREKIHQALQSFYTKINHDTRNSLSAIHASCTLLKHTALDEKQRRYCDTIESNSQFLLNLIQDILEFSSMSGQPITRKEQPISLLHVVKNSVIAIGTLAHEKGLEIVLQWDNSIPSVMQGDPVRLSQILINLLQNAVKFTAKGTVSLKGELVGLTTGHAKVKLSVHDTGKGIDEQTLHCFLIDDDDTPLPSFGEGYGLGLGIVKQLSRALKGNLEVQSCVGQGTTFSLGLEFLISPRMDSSFSTLDSVQVLVVGTPSPAVAALLALMQEHGAAIEYASDCHHWMIRCWTWFYWIFPCCKQRRN
jgi:signal transduction histidine kinase